MGTDGGWEEVSPEPEEAEEVYEEEDAEPESSYDEGEVERPRYEPPPREPVARPDKSVLAMVSGLGFFVAVLLLLFGASGPGREGVLGLILAGMVLGTIIPYLWMLDDLRIRPRGVRKSHARFLAGPMLGVLAIVLFGLFTLTAGDLVLLLVSIGVIAITQVSVALFLYSMLWEE